MQCVSIQIRGGGNIENYPDKIQYAKSMYDLFMVYKMFMSSFLIGLFRTGKRSINCLTVKCMTRL